MSHLAHCLSVDIALNYQFSKQFLVYWYPCLIIVQRHEDITVAVNVVLCKFNALVNYDSYKRCTAEVMVDCTACCNDVD